MGEGQETAAKTLIHSAQNTGKWVILNNCHLSTEFMEEIVGYLNTNKKVPSRWQIRNTTNSTTKSGFANKNCKLVKNN